MSERPIQNLEFAQVKEYEVAAASTVTKGMGVKLSSGKALNCAAVGDNCVGIALTGGAAGEKVKVALISNAIVPVKVGTGGATAGAPAKYAADGATNGTVGGGTTKLVVWGQFVETGVVGDFVGLNLNGFSFTVGS
jgi:hypothetical protein